jgi:hypothetical protein
MRFLAAAVFLGSALPGSEPAETAPSARKSKTYHYAARSQARTSGYYATRSAAAQEYSDPDCIRANVLDPGGNYKGYPCWARAALAPKDFP